MAKHYSEYLTGSPVSPKMTDCQSCSACQVSAPSPDLPAPETPEQVEIKPMQPSKNILYKCNSCDLECFEGCSDRARLQLETLDWLRNIPGLNYQSEQRAEIITDLIKETEMASCSKSSKGDYMEYLFLAIGEVLSNNLSILPDSDSNGTFEVACTRDAYVCWKLTSGEIYAVDLDNRSRLFQSACGFPGHNDPRWTKDTKPIVWRLLDRSDIAENPFLQISYEQEDNLFASPLQIKECSRMIGLPDTKEMMACLRNTMINTLLVDIVSKTCVISARPPVIWTLTE